VVVEQVVKTLDTVAEATRFCASHLPGSPTQEIVEACGQRLVGKTAEQAERLLSGPLDEVLERLGLGSPLDPLCLPALGNPCD